MGGLDFTSRRGERVRPNMQGSPAVFVEKGHHVQTGTRYRGLTKRRSPNQDDTLGNAIE